MSDSPNPDLPPDVALLLRAHAEQRWLSREVIPVVRQIETCERLPEDQIAAAVAYLEVTWAEALGHARTTESARERLDELGGEAELAHEPEGPTNQPLQTRTRRYHAVVMALREAVARRVAPLLAAPADSHVGRQAFLQDTVR